MRRRLRGCGAAGMATPRVQWWHLSGRETWETHCRRPRCAPGRAEGDEMTTLPPYPGPSDLEREALAEEARQVALPDSPQAWRNKRIFILIVIAFLARLLFFGLLTGHRVAGWLGMIAFAILWLVPSAIVMAAGDGF